MYARHPFRFLAACAAVLGMAGPVVAVTAAECMRVTHPTHGGEADHVDLGDGRVMWRDWWSQEGSATNYALVECQSGETLRLRTQEANMNARGNFDRDRVVTRMIKQQLAGARAFATLERMAAELDDVARDVVVQFETQETCACAAFYPQMRGDKTAFMLEGF
ncbi:MAG: hypothetical protein WBG95_07240 [Sulfitobacter sp.]